MFQNNETAAMIVYPDTPNNNDNNNTVIEYMFKRRPSSLKIGFQEDPILKIKY